MECDEIRPMLAGYADGQLTPLEHITVERHVEGCGRCRQLVRDQEQVRHVMGSYVPPAVPAERWNALGKVLRAELAGEGEPRVLRTRPRIDTLDPTPLELPAERPAGPGAREFPEPGTGPLADLPRSAVPPPRLPEAPPVPRVFQRRPPSISVVRVAARRARRRGGWAAHIAGALAAALVLGLAYLGTLRQTPELPIDLAALARQSDVEIHEIQTMDRRYDVVYWAGPPGDVAAVWVVPIEDEGRG
jgi:anti-sigma factor RsiW